MGFLQNGTGDFAGVRHQGEKEGREASHGGERIQHVPSPSKACPPLFLPLPAHFHLLYWNVFFIPASLHLPPPISLPNLTCSSRRPVVPPKCTGRLQPSWQCLGSTWCSARIIFATIVKQAEHLFPSAELQNWAVTPDTANLALAQECLMALSRQH